MTRNPGHLPRAAIGKSVRVILVNGLRPTAAWSADGKGGCRWSLTGGPFDIAFYEVIA